MTTENSQPDKIIIKFAVEKSPDDMGTVTYDTATRIVTVQHMDATFRRKVISHYKRMGEPQLIEHFIKGEDGVTRRTYFEQKGERGIDSAEAFLCRSSELWGALGLWVIWDEKQDIFE